jgi:signal transduction histidine kinase
MSDKVRNGGAPERVPDRPSVTVGTMAAGVAHEFNNLLAGILAATEEALEHAADPETKRNLRLIIRKVEGACLVTDKLLQFACQGHLERRPTDLAAVLEGALALMAPMFRRQGVVVIRQFRPVERLDLDAPRLEQVFLNLLRNAGEAMGEAGGRLTVDLLPEGTDAVVRIHDSGPGIAPETLGRVFDPFFTTRGILADGDSPAQGLGLSLCQGVVRMHGGRIDITTDTVEGTTVTVRLPRDAASGGATDER